MKIEKICGFVSMPSWCWSQTSCLHNHTSHQYPWLNQWCAEYVTKMLRNHSKNPLESHK